MGSSSSKKLYNNLITTCGKLLAINNDTSKLSEMYGYLITNKEAIQKIKESNLTEAPLVIRYDQTIRNVFELSGDIEKILRIIDLKFFNGLDDRFNKNILYKHMKNLREIYTKSNEASKFIARIAEGNITAGEKDQLRL